MKKISNCSLNLEQENIKKLKELFPEAVQEGKVDFNILKTILGSEIMSSVENSTLRSYHSIKNR